MRPISAVVLATVALLACATEVSPEDFELPPGAPPPVLMNAAELVVAADHSSFVVDPVASYTNETGRLVYFARCQEAVTEPVHQVIADNGGVFPRIGYSCDPDISTGQISPGRTVVIPIDLNPRIVNSEYPGSFRVRLELCTRFAEHSTGCELLPDRSRESAPFRVVSN